VKESLEEEEKRTAETANIQIQIFNVDDKKICIQFQRKGGNILVFNDNYFKLMAKLDYLNDVVQE